MLGPCHRKMPMNGDLYQNGVDATAATPCDTLPLVGCYTEEELNAMREVRSILNESHKVQEVGLRFLALTTIICKCRVDDAVSKYLTFLNAIQACGVDAIKEDSLWERDSVGDELRQYYAPCGSDTEGRSIMWIRGEDPINPEQESTSVHAGLLYYIAIHADAISLREGIVFCIDISNRNPAVRYGNEMRLQKVKQSYPLRPKAILIAGASFSMRIVVNGVIKVMSLFIKQKLLQRIRFVTLEEAVDSVPLDSAPKYLGGGGGGVDDIVKWTKERFEAFPVPEL